MITGLAANSNYTVCFDGSNATGGPSATGYAPQCFSGIAYDGSYPPPAGTAVAVTAGTTTSGINAALLVGGAISGTVTAASDGVGLGNVYVAIFSGANQIAYGWTAGDGTYTIAGLPPSSNYLVCFNGSSATGGSSAIGYLDQCYNGVTWDGSSAPAGTPVSVSTGSVTLGVNGSLVART